MGSAHIRKLRKINEARKPNTEHLLQAVPAAERYLVMKHQLSPLIMLEVNLKRGSGKVKLSQNGNK